MSIKKLAGQTAIYGVSSILGRFLNYMLVPLYTRVFATGEYGVVTQYYALAGFLMVLLSYRLDSALFRFGTDIAERDKTYSTCVKLVLLSSVCLLFALLPFVPAISTWIGQPDHPEYLYMFMGILATDALCELPFARLRLDGRPLRFASLKLINIGLNIGLNLFFLVLCPWLIKQGYTFFERIYDPQKGVFYVFLSNLIAGMITVILLAPEWLKANRPMDWGLVRKMLPYALPLVIVSLAGITDEMLSRAILTKLLPGTQAENQQALGIFGANYKIAALLVLATQAYRYAAEPFFFKHTREGSEALKLHAHTTKWFTVIISGVMLALMLSLDVLKLFVGEQFRSGITVVPLLLIASALLGVYYNFSAWFRLRDRTMTGAIISTIGALITVLALFVLVPRFGLMGAAASSVTCYAFMVITTYLAGRKHYPAPYQIWHMAGYFCLAVGLYYGFEFFAYGKFFSPALLWASRLCCLAIYAGVVYLVENRSLPVEA